MRNRESKERIIVRGLRFIIIGINKTRDKRVRVLSIRIRSTIVINVKRNEETIMKIRKRLS